MSKEGLETPFRAVIKLKSGANRAFGGFATAKAAYNKRVDFIKNNKSKVSLNELANGTSKKKATPKKKTPPKKKRTPTKKLTPRPKKKTPKKKPTPKKTRKQKSPKKKASRKTTKKLKRKSVALTDRLAGTTQLKKNGKWRGVVTLRSGSKKTFGMFDTMEEAFDVKEEWKKKNKKLLKKKN